MNHLFYRAKLALFVNQLKKRNALPQNINLTTLGSTFIATTFDEVGSSIITETVATGVSQDSNLAIIKALVEYCERNAFRQGKVRGLSSCQTNRSDGLAAFPRVLSLPGQAKQWSRSNAYIEAVERYVWATWWDNPEISYRSNNILDEPFKNISKSIDLLSEADKLVGLTKCLVVRPYFLSPNAEVILLFGFLENGGVISGGAGGYFNNPNQTIFRAASELYRHALGVYRITKEHKVPESFYEKRLALFGTGEASSLVHDRLRQNSSTQIILPNLKIDEAVSHDLDEIISIYRCYFENQPPFVGGSLERLCL